MTATGLDHICRSLLPTVLARIPSRAGYALELSPEQLLAWAVAQTARARPSLEPFP